MTGKIRNNLNIRILGAVLAAEILIIAALLIGSAGLKTSNISKAISLDTFNSAYTSYDNTSSSWSIGESDVTRSEGGHVYFLRGPYLDLPKGDYRVTVSYRTDGLQYVKAYSDSANKKVIAAFERLEASSGQVSFDIRLKEDINDLEFVFLYMEHGTFTVDSVSYTTMKQAPLTRTCLALASFFLLGDIVAGIFIFSSQKPDRAAVTAVSLAFILSSLPLLAPGLAQGHDLPFHATRIEGIWQEFLAGQFPVKMESLWLGGHGYASEIYYGDLFLYYPALLRLAGFTITESIKLYILFINILTSLISYASFRRIFDSRYAPAVACVLYTCSTFRLTDCYVRTTAGEMAALIFLPVVACGFIEILRRDPARKIRDMIFDGLILAAGMSGLIVTHIITTEIVLVVLILLSFIEFKKMIRRIPTVICAIVSTFLITCSFTVPFLDYTMKVSTRISVWMMADSDRLIQDAGAPLSSYLKFARPFFGSGAAGTDNMMSLTPGLLLIAFTIASPVFIALMKAGKRMIISLISSLILLFMASNIFPWNFLEQNLFFGKALVSIQFPWRLLGIAVLFMSLTAGDVMSLIEKKSPKKEDKNPCLILFVIVLVIQSAMAGITFYAYMTEGNFDVQYIDTASLDTAYLGDNEYVPSGVDLDKLTYVPSVEKGVKYEVIESAGGYGLTLTSPAPGDFFIEVPVIYYPYYKAYDKEGKTLEISSGNNGLIRITVPRGYEGDITVRFTSPGHWKIADIVSLLSFTWAMAYAVLYRKENTPAN